MRDPIILAAHAGVRLAHGTPTINGVEIPYAVGGAGEAVSLLHGAPKPRPVNEGPPSRRTTGDGTRRS